MVGKKPPTPTGGSSRKSSGEPNLAQRLRRNISPKNLDLTAGLSWREERELNKALYASLQETKKLAVKSEKETEDAFIPTNSIPRRNLMSRVLPRRQSPRSSKPSVTSKPTLPPPADKRLKSQYSISGGDESSQDSVRSSTTSCSNEDTKGRTKVRAQRKFAQMHAYGNTMVPSQHTPVKPTSKSSSPIKVFPKRAKTEDFLTFLCLRGTQALPPHLDFFNFSRNEGDTSLPPTPPNRGRGFVRESSPSSSSTSCSNVPDDVADSPAPLVMPPSGRMTPSRKAARACAGTPETARGLASFPSRQGRRSQAASRRRLTSPAVTPAKCTRSYRARTPSPTKGTPSSPGKRTDAERLKRKAIATLTSSKHSSDQITRRKSLFIEQSAIDGSAGSKRQTKVTGVSDTSSVVTGTNSGGEEARDSSEGVSRSGSSVDLPQVSCFSNTDIVHAHSVKSALVCCTSQSGTACIDDDVSMSGKQSQVLSVCMECSFIGKPCKCVLQTPGESTKDVPSCPNDNHTLAEGSISPKISPTQAFPVTKSSFTSMSPNSACSEDVTFHESFPHDEASTLQVKMETSSCRTVPSMKDSATPFNQTLHSMKESISSPKQTISVPSENSISTTSQIASPTKGSVSSPVHITSIANPDSTSQTISFSTDDSGQSSTQTPSPIEESISSPTQTISFPTEDFSQSSTPTLSPFEKSISSPTQTLSIYTEDCISLCTKISPTEGPISTPTEIISVSAKDNPQFLSLASVDHEESSITPTQNLTGPTEDSIPLSIQSTCVSEEDANLSISQASNPVASTPVQSSSPALAQTTSSLIQTSSVSTMDIICCPIDTSIGVSIPVRTSSVPNEDVICSGAISFHSQSAVFTKSFVSKPAHSSVSTHNSLSSDVISCPAQASAVSTDETVSMLPKPKLSLDSSSETRDLHTPQQSGSLIKSRFNWKFNTMMNESQYLDVEVRKTNEQKLSNTCQSEAIFTLPLTLSKEDSQSNQPSDLASVSSYRVKQAENENSQSVSGIVQSSSDDGRPKYRARKRVSSQQQKTASPLSLGCAVNIDDSGFIDSLESSTLASPFSQSMPLKKNISDPTTPKLLSPKTQPQHKLSPQTHEHGNGHLESPSHFISLLPEALLEIKGNLKSPTHTRKNQLKSMDEPPTRTIASLTPQSQHKQMVSFESPNQVKSQTHSPNQDIMESLPIDTFAPEPQSPGKCLFEPPSLFTVVPQIQVQHEEFCELSTHTLASMAFQTEPQLKTLFESPSLVTLSHPIQSQHKELFESPSLVTLSHPIQSQHKEFFESPSLVTLSHPTQSQHKEFFESPSLVTLSHPIQSQHKKLFESPSLVTLSHPIQSQHKELFESPTYTLASMPPKSKSQHKGILTKYMGKASIPSKKRSRKENFVSFLLPPKSASPKFRSHKVATPKPILPSSSKIMRIDPPVSTIVDAPVCHLIASPTSNFKGSPSPELPLRSEPVVHAKVDNCPIIANASILPQPAPPYSVLSAIRKQKLAARSSKVSTNEVAVELSNISQPYTTTLGPSPPVLCFRDIPQSF